MLCKVVNNEITSFRFFDMKWKMRFHKFKIVCQKTKALIHPLKKS
jgi:hypothetical protein